MSSASAGIRTRPQTLIVAGVGAGVLGAVVMAAFAMIASATYHGVGFFTPMYHIASSVIGPEAMMASAEAAQGGEAFHFVAGPAILGFVIHLAVGGFFGALFPILGRLLGARGAAWIPLGLAYGLAVLAVMSFVGLPVVAEVLGGGQPIADMPAMAGWWTFAIEHLLFGGVLGLSFARAEPWARRRRVPAA
jgi:hypothetical protein